MTSPFSIVLAVVWMGPFPSWMNLWLHSCAYNPSVDWVVVTDNSAFANAPANVRFVTMTLEEVRERASSMLGFSVSLRYPYKLCDFKPAYGAIFGEHFRGYSFWGYCDLDMVFGDLRSFLTDDILTEHHKVLNRGHLTLYRNDDIGNNLFRLPYQDLDYRHVLSSDRHFGFDEWRGIHKILNHHGVSQFHDEFIADIRPARHKLLLCHGQNYDPQVFCWVDGRVYRRYWVADHTYTDEFAYIHFQKRTMASPTFSPSERRGFYITPRGFIPISVWPHIPTSPESLNWDVGLYSRLWRLRQWRRTLCQRAKLVIPFRRVAKIASSCAHKEGKAR